METKEGLSEGDVVEIKQTEHGDYNSTPSAKDIMTALSTEESEWGKSEWANEAAKRGHDEYIDNVYSVAKYCQQHGIKDEKGVEMVLKQKLKYVEN